MLRLACRLRQNAFLAHFMLSELRAMKKALLRQIGGRDHFRSHDNDGGHTIRSVIAENPMLHANFTRLYSTEEELLSIQLVSDLEFLRCPNFAGAVGEKLYICF